LRIGVLFTGVGLLFVILFLVFFKEEGTTNNVILRSLKYQNFINLKKSNENSSNIDSISDDDHHNEKLLKLKGNNIKGGKENTKSYVEEVEDEEEAIENYKIVIEEEEERGEDIEKMRDELLRLMETSDTEDEKNIKNENEKKEKEVLREEEKSGKKINNKNDNKNENKVEQEKEKKKEKEEEEGFNMEEYSKSVHLKSTSPLTFFKLYHQGRNYRDKDDPEGKKCPIPWQWVENENESDIIVMNVLDNISDIKRIERYHYNKKHQKLLLMSMESTTNYDVMRSKKKYFDYFIDYRLDSDVPIPYTYTFFKFDKPALPVNEKGKGGRGVAAVFISNCFANNDRLEFLDELMEHMKIDSFGMCSHNKEVYDEDEGDSAWNTKLNTIRKYKFTLAFENSDDRDYVTEKFFQPLEVGSVPVFYGTSNIADFAPPHSYINAKDFSSAKELADYLKFLDRNDDEYESYLEWKKKGDIGDNLRHLIAIRKINSICYLLQRIKGMWINPYLTIWDRKDVSKKERACGLC
jgi:hypothetical protein